MSGCDSKPPCSVVIACSGVCESCVTSASVITALGVKPWELSAALPSVPRTSGESWM